MSILKSIIFGAVMATAVTPGHANGLVDKQESKAGYKASTNVLKNDAASFLRGAGNPFGAFADGIDAGNAWMRSRSRGIRSGGTGSSKRLHPADDYMIKGE